MNANENLVPPAEDVASAPPSIVARLADFPELHGTAAAGAAGSLNHLLDVSVSVTAELGRVTMPIREAGTGEVVYSQGGTRRSCGARSDNGAPIARGAEVVVTRYEAGIAYVRLWEEFAREEENEGGSS